MRSPQEEQRMSSDRICCVIPALNERHNIGRLVSALRGRLGPEITVIVVNDGSTDDTGALARAAGALEVRHAFPLGYGAALQSGFRLAHALGAQVVVTLDADGQHDPASVTDLLKPLQEDGADVVIGCRYHRGNASYSVPLARQAGHRFFSWLIHLFCGLRIEDPTSGFQAIRHTAFPLVLSDTWPHDYPDADVIITYHRMGLRIVEVPAQFHPAPETRKSMHAGVIRPLWYLYAMGISFLRLTLAQVAVRKR
jgi:glycosyltransferase involved in cell wall biosynthesis